MLYDMTFLAGRCGLISVGDLRYLDYDPPIDLDVERSGDKQAEQRATSRAR